MIRRLIWVATMSTRRGILYKLPCFAGRGAHGRGVASAAARTALVGKGLGLPSALRIGVVPLLEVIFSSIGKEDVKNKDGKRDDDRTTMRWVRGWVARTSVRKTFTYCQMMDLRLFPPLSVLTRGSGVKGTASPVWVRKIFNYFLSL